MEPQNNKKSKKKITLTYSEVINRSSRNISLFEDLSFYNKSVFFTDNLIGDRNLYYQLVGYRGGHSEPIEFPSDTSIAVIADKAVEYLKISVKHYMIDYIEMKLNNNPNLNLLTESDFLQLMEQHAKRVKDEPSLGLLNRINESS